MALESKKVQGSKKLQYTRYSETLDKVWINWVYKENNLIGPKLKRVYLLDFENS